MGRYETTLKYVQMGRLLEEGDEKKALSIAQNINIAKVRYVPELKTLAEVYIANGIYDKARDIYMLVYEECNTRRILYKLIDLCIKSEDIAEAERLYQIYLLKDSSSIDRLAIRYRIDKANQEKTEVLIKDLLAIKEEEYIEEWAYELAKQYHKAGLIDECIAECRNINIWFAGGETAEKAAKLARHYNNEALDFLKEDNDKEEAPKKLKPVVTVSDDTKDIRTELTEGILSGLAAAEEQSEDLDGIYDGLNNILEQTLKEAAQEAAENEQTDTSVGEQTLDEDAVSPVEGLSKYGQELGYTHVKPLFKGLEKDVDIPANIAMAASEPTYYLTVVKKITKVLQNRGYMNVPNIRIAKINAETLNSLDIMEQIDELKGTCVMIEAASKMNSQTINGIIKMLDVYSGKVAIVLVDDEEPLSKMLFKEEILKNQIKYFVAV